MYRDSQNFGENLEPRRGRRSAPARLLVVRPSDVSVAASRRNLEALVCWNGRDVVGATDLDKGWCWSRWPCRQGCLKLFGWKELRGIGVKVQSEILRGIRSQSEFRAGDVQLVVGIMYVVGRVQSQVFDVGREVREWGGTSLRNLENKRIRHTLVTRSSKRKGLPQVRSSELHRQKSVK
jgi:hypothetical protein